ncbi:MAG: ferric reductase-like transmembrane domain-containing protein [Acidimicrobiales bacterium]|nr:ferric reductase-like transmembrane domain-containing protein [Acidimicrobiales bacterium]
MRVLVQGFVYIAVFVGVALAPLVFAAIGVAESERGVLTELSAAFGFVGLALMGLEFALIARFKQVAAPFGTDALLQFHRQMGLVGLALILGHVAISADWGMVATFWTADTPWRVRFGLLAVVALLALVAISVWRTELRIRYEIWHVAHGVLAVVAVTAAVVHVVLVDFYLDVAWKRALWFVMAATFLGLLGWVRLVKPLVLRHRPWVVTDVRHERGRTATLTMRPDGHAGFGFEPGQFAWIVVGGSPFSVTQHPFSFSSSAEDPGQVSVSIKALGDFTSTVGDTAVGTRVYVDGPHGVFSLDRYEGAGFAFVAGGVGITPTMSMLRTLADRGDVRPVVVFVGGGRWDDLTFREEIEELEQRLDLTVVWVLTDPPEGWAGESGFITAEVLDRHLPRARARFQYFVCGPNPMMDAMEDALLALSIAPERIHTERFGWV